MSEENNGSVFMGMVWMFIISLLLFWLPGIGSLIAGIVGGKQAGGVMNGMMAALLPGILLGIVLVFTATFLTALPIVGVALGGLGFLVYVIYIAPLLVGALIGGLLV